MVKSTKSRPAAAAAQRGVSLMEVLVANIVLSIGLLGLAGLQAAGMRVSQSSVHRGLAAQLAYDMIDRVRANAANAVLYRHALGDEMPACAEAPGNGEQVAACDLRDWAVRLRALPAGAGAVAVAGTTVTVTVQWDDRRGAGVLRGSEAEEAAREALRTSRFELSSQLSN
jgi:type IV pilus assembly protein PilV